jgi:hypothetical protein
MAIGRKKLSSWSYTVEIGICQMGYCNYH